MSGHVKIVLPCRNEREWLRATVDSILETTRHPSFEIFVLANDDTRTDFGFVDTPACRNRVKLKRVPRRLGVGLSINAAVEPGDADYYVFLDAHCLVQDDDWLHRVVDCLEAHPNASMVQPEVHQFVLEDASSDQLAEPEKLQVRLRAYSIVWAWPYDGPGELAYVCSAPASDTPYRAMAGGGMAVFTRAETFHRLGRYDPEVNGWYPETMDYCVRAWMLDYPMMVDPTVRVWHRIKAAPDTPRDFQDVVHGVLRTAWKYLSPRRRDMAELLFRGHGLGAEVDRALGWIRQGRWLSERARHLRSRVHDDDWLFEEFQVYEERYGIGD